MASNVNDRKPGRSERADAAESMDMLMKMSRLLNTGLDQETMAICLRLCENGVNPEALALVIKELRREAANVKADSSSENR